uniref:Uncharacterized protein n=1 Tax=Panagrolaimus sp. PS1159 TaxID=55785 RepID=A0AC35G7S9_9BILA
MGGRVTPRPAKIPDGIWHVSVESLEDFERVHWNDRTQLEKAAHVISILIKISLLILTLIIFLLTLALLSTAFQLVGGRGIGSLIKNSPIIKNPICAACVGMLVTVVLQSSSTLSSVLVAMVAGHLLKVREAIPILMGSELGASFMNAFIGLGQSGDRAQFRRAYAAVALGDIYNFLCFFILLPLEIFFAPIQRLSKLMVSPIRISHKSTQEIPSLTVLTDPLLDRIIQVDFDALDDALEDDLMEPDSVWQESFIERCINLTTLEEFTFCSHTHLFAYSTLDDTSIAIILLIASIISLILTTLIIVKLIQMLLEGKLAIVLKEWLDKKFPSPFRWATNYLIMLLSCFLVMI